MMEDKLLPGQRIRLEALAQANAVMHGSSIEERIEGAKKFAEFIEMEENK
jgi:hypothetical protein